jgi:protein N-terminal amidase
MDLNPYQFKASFHDYEYATYHTEQDSDLLLCCMAWIASKADEDEQRCMSTIEYWAIRLSPFIRRKPNPNKHTIFLACNRHGTEEGKYMYRRLSQCFTHSDNPEILGVTYAGASCVMRLDSPRAVLLDYLETSETAVMIVETEVGTS